VERTAELARQAKVTQGRKVRLDGTCVQTDIHHPTDSGLLVDRVRTLSRLVQQANGTLLAQGTRPEQVRQWCRSRLRTARRVAQRLHRQLRRTGEDKEAEQRQRYAQLVEATEQMVHQATTVV
jgi:IS5 family transposase